jgi:tRNA/rRNA methyltransferase
VAPTVVLVRPQEEGNVGAVARAMANLGLARLVLVEPAVAIGEVARARARGAWGILARAKRCPSLALALAPFRRVVGTTSLRGRRRSGPPLLPRQWAERLAAAPAAPTALVFGPETSGLTDHELALCGTVVAIPAAPRHPTLNLAQAVAIVAYELRLARLGEGGRLDGGERRARGRAGGVETAGEAASFAQVEGLFAQLEVTLREIGFARDTTFPGVLRDLRRLAAKSGLSAREVTILRGICHRASLALRRAARPNR